MATLSGLVTECQRLSNLKHDTALVEKKLTSSTVQAVRHTKQPNNQTKSSADGKSPPSPCWQCGAMHFVKGCQFSKHFCKQCGKIGHKEGYCGCFATPSSSKSVGDKKKKKKSCSTKVIQTVQQVNSRRKYISVIFNKTVAKLQLDCGSDITVISHTTWKTIGSPSFSTTSVEASTASGEPLELVGEFISPITIGHVTKTTICYITSVENLNIIGLDWMDAFDLWSKPLAAYCKQDVQPVFRPKWPVPFHAIQKLTKNWIDCNASGVKSAPGIFQQLMSKMVSGIRGVEVFLDDILVHSKTLEEHNRILNMLFRRLFEYGFHLRAEKCRLYQDQIK
ncbi:uncharacterized protein K02A2.6-like [Armigeres subalbatus]|uniref:uncharacterized protein K02A2.6-like n=1 Tax=Armigeres subalbatus TaxID=124917 RepID=UPI002ED1ED24